ncbi:hypothetical protein D3C81_768010 [compost metagenome]
MALRHRALFNAGNRHAGFAIEQEDLALFGDLRQRWLGAALAVRHVVQQRLRRQVEVPQIVVGGLEVPTNLAGLHVDGDDGRVPLVVHCGALAAEEIWRRVAGW